MSEAERPKPRRLSMTAQEVLNTVAAQLLKQGAKSMASDGKRCSYRGEGDLRCSVGALIPDEAYSLKLESQGVEVLLERGRCLQHLSEHWSLLTELMYVHDVCPVEAWPRRLRGLAEIRGLEVPEGCR